MAPDPAVFEPAALALAPPRPPYDLRPPPPPPPPPLNSVGWQSLDLKRASIVARPCAAGQSGDAQEDDTVSAAACLTMAVPACATQRRAAVRETRPHDRGARGGARRHSGDRTWMRAYVRAHVLSDEYLPQRRPAKYSMKGTIVSGFEKLMNAYPMLLPCLKSIGCRVEASPSELRGAPHTNREDARQYMVGWPTNRRHEQTNERTNKRKDSRMTNEQT